MNDMHNPRCRIRKLCHRVAVSGSNGEFSCINETLNVRVCGVWGLGLKGLGSGFRERRERKHQRIRTENDLQREVTRSFGGNLAPK